MKIVLVTFSVSLALGTAVHAAGHSGPSTFQNTCSNIEFVYQGNDAAISATCLRADGTPNATTMAIPGISNQNGVLTAGQGASSFQQSCGSISIETELDNVTLYANCRTESGEFNESSIGINGINNNDGNLSM